MKTVEQATWQALSPERLSGQEPIIFRGLLKEWPLVRAGQQSSKNAADYLASFYNHKPVHTLVASPEQQGRLFYNEDLSDFNFSRQNADLTDIVARILEAHHNAPTYYVGSTSLDYILPGLREDNPLPPLSDTKLVNIWVGNRSRIAAHYDIPDNLACVAAGKRRFTLFPPDQLDNLYIGPLDYTPAGQAASLVDFHQPDFERFPKFRQALSHAQVVELEAGDALFIPSMWWHHIEGLSDFNILVNYWWRQVPGFMGAPMDAMLHAIMNIRELPAEQRDIWRNMFEHYVFNPKEQAHIPESRKGVLASLNDDKTRQLRSLLINKLNR